MTKKLPFREGVSDPNCAPENRTVSSTCLNPPPNTVLAQHLEPNGCLILLNG